MPFLISPAAASVGEPLTCRTPPFGFSLLDLVDERLREHRAKLLVIERHVVVGRDVGNRAVISDDRHLLRLGLLHHRRRGRRVHRVENDRLDALRQRRIHLLLLLGGVGVGVLVQHRAARTELLQALLEQRLVGQFVARRRRVGHEEADLRVPRVTALPAG
jgi:hypothetical protein